MKFSRRNFLQSASAGFGVTLLNRPVSANDFEQTVKEIRANLLKMVNEEREVEEVQPVELDELANQVATNHAAEMAKNDFASHWGFNGFKAYHRYSFAGGTEATQENVSAANNTWSSRPRDLKQDTAYLHVRLYQEKPPQDGHRKTILAPQHTHVGFGIALQDLRLRLVELFVARYLTVKPVQREAKPGAEITFSAKMIRPGFELNHVEVFYEPIPVAPELAWLRSTGSYALPKEFKVLRPRVPPPLRYSDGQQGVIEMGLDGSFRAPVRLFKDKPGIYTVVAWIRKGNMKTAFPATEMCVKAV